MSFFENIFGRQKTPQEQLREYKRMIDRAIRDIERERMQMQNQEKKLIADIKKMAKENQLPAARIMAKDLVRTRAYITKFYKMRGQLQTVSLRLQTLKSTAAMTDAMKGVTKAMVNMNKQINLPGLQKIMMEFEKQTEIMDMKQDMMNDTIDDVLGDENEEEESEALVNQVLDEIGIGLNHSLQDTPAEAAPEKQPAAAAAHDAEDQELLARLENLRKM